MFTRIMLPLGIILSFAVATPALAQSSGWQKQIVSMVVKAQNYPKAALNRKEQGTAKVRVKINDAGIITGVELAQSSGSPALDSEATAMIEKIGSFPAPPAGAVNLVIPITWVLN
jgi:TonB family protein